MTTQVFNDELMNLIATDFQRRYEPNFAWGNVMSFYQQLPGLIGFWPGSIGTTANSGFLRDMSGSEMHLTPGVGAVEQADTTGLRRWNPYNGSSQYFSATDTAFNSILGNEGTIHSTIRGLTVMAWVRPSGTPAASEAIASKWNSTGNQRSWLLFRTTGLNGLFQVSGDGTAFVQVGSTNDFISGEWRFIAARYIPSTQIRIWEGFTYGLVTNENATSIPATLFNSTTNLAVGAINTDTAAAAFYEGDLSLIALCRAALPDLFIESIFNLTRPLFIRR